MSVYFPISKLVQICARDECTKAAVTFVGNPSKIALCSEHALEWYMAQRPQVVA